MMTEEVKEKSKGRMVIDCCIWFLLGVGSVIGAGYLDGVLRDMGFLIAGVLLGGFCVSFTLLRMRKGKS